jgi:hypothetical protein
VAGEVHDPRLVDRAARLLAAAPGGPGLGEARRRLTQGLPLIVGLPWADVETLQDQLVELGLIPRLGPAPEGTAPLRGEPVSPRRAVWLGLAGGAMLLAIVFALRPERVPPGAAPAVAQPTTPVRQAPIVPRVRSRPAAPPAAMTVPADRRLEVGARVQFARDGLQIEGWASAPASDEPPAGPLTLIGRVAGVEVLAESLPESHARTRRESGSGLDAPAVRTLPFRVPLYRERLGSAAELELEATWGDWRSEPLRIEIPQT